MPSVFLTFLAHRDAAISATRATRETYPGCLEGEFHRATRPADPTARRRLGADTRRAASSRIAGGYARHRARDGAADGSRHGAHRSHGARVAGSHRVARPR